MQRILLFICLLSCGVTTAQKYSFVHYTPKDGLVNSRIRSAYQDSKGRMYFLTNGGLSVYDGTHFTNYTQSNGLTNNIVNDIYEAGPDSFLIASNGHPLNALVNGKMKIMQTVDSFCPTINKFFKSHNHTFYAVADEGLFIYDNNVFTKIPLQVSNNGSDIGFINSVVEYRDYLIFTTWSGTEKNKVFLYNEMTKKVIDIYNPVSASSLSQNKITGQIFLILNGGIRIIDATALNSGKIKLNNFSLPGVGPDINSVVFTNDNNLWLYNRETVAMPVSSGKYELITATNGLPVNNILSVFIDRENIKWIITDGSGVLKLVNTGFSVISYLPSGKKIDAGSIDCDSSGLWFFDKSSNRIFQYTQNGFTGYALPFFKGLNGFIKKGGNFFCFNNQAVYSMKYDGMFFGKPRNLYKFNNVTPISPNVVIDTAGNIHINVLDKESSDVLSLLPDGKGFTYPLKIYADEIKTDDNRLLAITRITPLQIFSIASNDSGCLRLLHDYQNELPQIFARSLAVDHKGHIIIGSRDRGIYILSMNGIKLQSVQNISMNEGLTDNFIYSLCCDNDGNIWVGSQNGLDKVHFHDKQYTIENISRNNNFFETIVSIKTNDNGMVWALSNVGNILQVANKNDTLPAFTPKLFVSDMTVNGQPFAFEKSLQTFKYNQNSISFSVAAPSFIDEHAVLFSYLLQGSNPNNWSVPSNQSNFNFLNLSPGDYTLLIKAAFPGNKYPEQQISYSFTIHPPWWQTWWFRILAVLLTGILSIILFRMYYRRKLEKQKVLLEKQQAVEKERTRIAMDMHDDLGAGLSRIKFLSESIGIKKQQHLPVEDEISRIREYSHDMIDKMGEIVWALNEKNDTISDLFSYTRAYATEYLLQNGIQLEMQAPDIYPEKFVTGDYRRNIFLTVKEALHNVVKHSAATTVTMEIKADKSLCITITDNGTGFDENNVRPYSSGMMNMKKRIEGINGSLRFENEKGTNLYITVPL